jgi:signal transduction histidine kinase
MNFFKKYYFFVFSLIFLTVALAFHYFMVSFNDYETYRSQVQRNMLLQISLLEQNLDEIQQKWLEWQQRQVVPNFEVLLPLCRFPTFIFKDRELLFWSENSYNLTYDQIKPPPSEYLLETVRGIVLVRSEALDYRGEVRNIVMLLPIQSNYKINNEFLQKSNNPDIFPSQEIGVTLQDYSLFSIVGSEGKPLFSLQIPANYNFSENSNYFVIFFIILSIIFFFLQLHQTLRYLLKREQPLQAFFLLLGALAAFRLLLLYSDLPKDWFESDLFNPQIYASSWLAPSLGDLLLNLSFSFVVLFFLFYYARNITSQFSHFHPTSFQCIWLYLLLVVVSMLNLYLHFDTLSSLYRDSEKLGLDINKYFNLNFLQFISLLVALLSAGSYFLLNYLLLRFTKKINISKIQKIAYLFVVYLICIFLSFALIDGQYEASTALFWVFSIHFLYFFFNILVDIIKEDYLINYKVFVQIFIGALAIALIQAVVVLKFEKIREFNQKQKISRQLLLESDLLGEYLLNRAIGQIKQDNTIINRLLSAFSSKEVITKKIRKMHLGTYFDKYDVGIFIFNGSGEPYNSEVLPYQDWVDRYALPAYMTEHDFLYLIRDNKMNEHHYVAFIEVFRENILVGKIIIELKPRKVIANSLYPYLLLDKQFIPVFTLNQFNYGIFIDNELIYSFGNFNYSNNLLSKFENKNGYEEIVSDGLRHFSASLQNQDKSVRRVVISSPTYSFVHFVSNISFVFLITLFILITFLFVHYFIIKKNKFSFTLRAKIQIYLNLAFFLPTLFLSVLILSILNRENKNEIIATYFKKAELVAQNLTEILQKQENDELSNDRLSEALFDIARYTQTEINLFNKEGALLATSQTAIFDNGILARRLNPQTMLALVEGQQPHLILSESIGKLEYNTVYIRIFSPSTRQLMGVVGLPFFESQKQAEKQISNIFSLIMNTFTGVLVLLIAVSSLVSRLLTKPLKLLTEKIQKTSLSDENKPLVYQSDDEIGLLVKEYNAMLVKLEESKNALAISEKESAWREMAKQVAHEIKNPLTPMKLTLQHLERAFAKENEQAVRSIKLLVNQVDTLTDIANSFAAFAKMPIPKNEKFDIAALLLDTLILFKNDQRLTFDAILPQGEFWVQGDKQLMGRIFTNLILNGVQAVPAEEDAHLNILLEASVQAQKVCISITDNGSGISEEVAKKIFIPNFSTKSSGSGIGLAVAKRGIEHAGGRIWFETRLGQGTTFFIELPWQQ